MTAIGLARLPCIPSGIRRFQLRQHFVPQRTGDAGQPFGARDRVPKGFCFHIVEYKRSVVGPTARSERKGLTIEFAAVHGSQIN